MSIDVDRALRNMPTEIREKLKQILGKYNQTGKTEYAKMAIDILIAFDDDPHVRDLVRRLRG